MRSPSRDSRKPSMKEEDIIEDYKKSHKDAPVRTISAFHSILPHS